MSDYTQITDFSVKDGLSTGDPEKIILGSDIDDELGAIQTAIGTKYDSSDIASSAEAQAETSNAKLITPLRLANWADANGGFVGDIQAMSDPNADNLLGWDDSGGTVVGYNPTNGLTTSGTALIIDPNAAGTGLSYSVGVFSVDYATEATMTTGTATDEAITPQRLQQKHQVAVINDVTFTTDTTLNDLTLSIGSGSATTLPISIGKYLVRASFRCNCSASGVDLKWSFAKGGSAALVLYLRVKEFRLTADTVAGVQYLETNLSSTFDEVVDIDSSTHANVLVEAEGWMEVTTGGTFSIQASQNSSSGTGVNLTGGVFELIRVDN